MGLDGLPAWSEVATNMSAFFGSGLVGDGLATYIAAGVGLFIFGGLIRVFLGGR